MDRAELLRANRDQILAIARRHGATDLRVFGSSARGEARPDSDLDILAAIEPTRSLFDIARFELDLEDLLGVKVDVVEERALSPFLKGNILSDVVPL